MPDSITPHVSPALRDRFLADGYLMPVDIFTEEEICSHRQELEELEQRLHAINAGNKSQLNYPHVLFRFANTMARNPRLLDVVESILGPDILVWGSTFFIKEPETESYVSWHQDMKYWGLSDTNGQVSAWIALNKVDQENGCMQFLPGSHQGEMLDHRDTFSETNILTRGQEADVEIDPDAIRHVELAPGQASFHHGKLLHASPPNRSRRRRIGLAVQFIAPHVRQQVAKTDFAMLVRGEDRYGYFELIDPPQDDLSPEAIALHQRILAAQNEAMYEGTTRPQS
ncbi:phytanoyl-CoA dioxygenase family protein [Alphaproteobacteria bacterium LSUCC0684]